MNSSWVIERKPLICAVLIAHDRLDFTMSSIRCFTEQTHDNKFLLIVHAGCKESWFDKINNKFDLHHGKDWYYFHFEENKIIGSLRNKSLMYMKSLEKDLTEKNFKIDYYMQWDDDDWCHPMRMEKQLEAIEDNDVCLLSHQVCVNVDDKFVSGFHVTGDSFGGREGTMLVRYDKIERGFVSVKFGEETHWLGQFKRKIVISNFQKGILPILYIRTFHEKSNSQWFNGPGSRIFKFADSKRGSWKIKEDSEEYKELIRIMREYYPFTIIGGR